MLQQLPSLFIRLGMAFVFTFAAVSMSLSPESYANYLPTFTRGILPAAVMLHIFGAFEVLLSLWLLSGKWLLVSSGLATLTIFSLTIVNLDSFPVLFRNVSIFFSGLALVAMHWSGPKPKQVTLPPFTAQKQVVAPDPGPASLSAREGFTLVEILVAISIISIMFGVVITAAARAQRQARDAQRLSDISKIQYALQQYYTDNGFYPSSQALTPASRNMSLDTLTQIDNCSGREGTCPVPSSTPRVYLRPIPVEPQPVMDSHYCYESWTNRSMSARCDNSSVSNRCNYYRLYVRLENSPGPNLTCNEPSGRHDGQNYFTGPD